jgi:kynureninase
MRSFSASSWALYRYLEVLEGLFDYFYVAPAKAQQKKPALNAKLAAANKPPMK